MEQSFLSLPIFVLAPILAVLFIISPLCPNNAVIIRRFAKWFAGVHFLYALCFFNAFNPNSFSVSFEQEILNFKFGWLGTMGSTATFGVDGLSLPLCVLASFIFFIALILSKYTIKSKYKLYYALIFLLETAVLGIFCAKDIFMFFMFWVLETVPMYFLISLWGGIKAEKYASKYLVISSIGSVLLLFGLLILYNFHSELTGNLTANIDALSFDEFINPVLVQIIVFLTFFFGFITKFPIFPLQTWYTDAQSEAPMPVNIILSTVVMNMGIYGIIRFNMQFFPETFCRLAFLLMLISVISIIGCTLCAFLQKNIKKYVSYINVSLLGFVLLGLSSVTEIGITGAIFHIFACSFVFASLFAITGFIYLRTKSLDIDELGGIARQMPKLMYFSFPVCFAIAGMPFLIIFPSELSIIIGAFTTELFEQVYFQISAVIVVLTLILIAISVLKLLHKVFYGNILSRFSSIKDISMSEFLSLLMLMIPVIIFGFAPMILINYYSNIVIVIMDILRIQ